MNHKELKYIHKLVIDLKIQKKQLEEQIQKLEDFVVDALLTQED